MLDASYGVRAYLSCSTGALQDLGSGVAVLRLSIWGIQVQLPRGMWDLSSLTNDRTHVPYTGRQILYHWTNKEVPSPEF